MEPTDKQVAINGANKEIEAAIANLTNCQNSIAKGFAKAAAERNEKKQLYQTLLAGFELMKAEEILNGRFSYKESKKYLNVTLKIDGRTFAKIGIRSSGDVECNISGSSSYHCYAASVIERIAETAEKLVRSPQPGGIKKMMMRPFLLRV